MLPNKSHQLELSRYFRFLLSGGINTGTTYLLYLLLITMMHYQMAYLISYAFGIALAYLLNLHFVFKMKSSLGKIAIYPLIYFTQYLLGAGLLYLLVSVLRVSNTLAPLLVIGLLFPITYYMNKRILVR